MNRLLFFFAAAALALPSSVQAEPSAAEIQLEAKIHRLEAQKRAAAERDAERLAAAQHSYRSARAELEASIAETARELDEHVNPNSPRPCSYQQKLKTGRPVTAYDKSEHEEHIRQLQAKLAQLHGKENALVMPQPAASTSTAASIDTEIAAARKQLAQARQKRDAEEPLRGATYVASTIFGAPAAKRVSSGTGPMIPADENPFPSIDRNPFLSRPPDGTTETELPTPPHRTHSPSMAEPVSQSAAQATPPGSVIEPASPPSAQELVDHGAIRLQTWDFDPAAGTPISRAIPASSAPIIDDLSYQYESTKPDDLYGFVAGAPLGSTDKAAKPAADNPDEFRNWVAGSAPKSPNEAKPSDAAKPDSAPAPKSAPPDRQ